MIFLKPHNIRFRGVILLENVVHEAVFVNGKRALSKISGNHIITGYVAGLIYHKEYIY
jgi:hypothetical protein